MIYPRKIIFGLNAIDDFCNNELPFYSGKSVLIISFSFINQRTLDERVINKLKEFGTDVNIYIYQGKEPEISDVDNLYQKFQGQQIDLIIGIGGGSVMDLTKAVSICLTKKLTCEKILDKQIKPEREINLFLLPTTAGTGSEVTDRAIIKKEKEKKIIIGDCLIPDGVVLDPIFLESIPFEIKLLTLFDTVSHALESLLSKKSNIVTELYAINALKIIAKKNKEYLFQSNKEINNYFQIASLQAGLSFGNAGVHLVHAFAYALSEQIHLSHSQSVSMCLLPVLEHKKINNLPKFREYKELIDRIIFLVSNYSEYVYKAENNIKNKELITQKVINNKRLMDNLPVEFNKEDLLLITDKIYEKISAKQI